VPPPIEANGSGVVQLDCVDVVVDVAVGDVELVPTVADTSFEGSLSTPSLLYARTRKVYVVPSTKPVKVQLV